MNEEYLKSLYDYLKVSDQGVSFDKFKLSIASNKEFNDNVFNFLKKDSPAKYDDSKRERYLEATGFNALSPVFETPKEEVKKKEGSADSSKDSSDDSVDKRQTPEGDQLDVSGIGFGAFPTEKQSEKNKIKQQIASLDEKLKNYPSYGDPRGKYEIEASKGRLEKELRTKFKLSQEEEQKQYGFDVASVGKVLQEKHQELIEKYLTDPQRLALMNENVNKASAETAENIYRIKENQVKYKDVGSATYNQNLAEDLREEILKDENDERERTSRNNFLDDTYSLAGEDIKKLAREEILKDLIPEDRKGDEAYLEELTDYVINNYGIDIDADRDGRYNEQLLIFDIAQSIGAGSVELGKGIASITGGEEAYKEWNEVSERLRASQTQYSRSGVIGEFDEGFSFNASYNAFRKASTGLAESLPIIGTTITVGALTGGVGAGATVGILTGTSASADAYYTKKYGDDAFWESLGEGLVVGAGEAAFGLVGARIFANATKEVLKGFSRQALKGYAKGHGMAWLEEGLTEAATELSTAMYEKFQGGEGSFESVTDLVRRVGDSFIIGGFSGSALKGIGQTVGGTGRRLGLVPSKSPFTGPNSIVENIQNQALKALNDRSKQLNEQISNAKDPETRDKLVRELLDVESKKGEVKKALVPFYEMMKYRHEDVFNRVSEIDAEIAALTKQYDEASGAIKQEDGAETDASSPVAQQDVFNRVSKTDADIAVLKIRTLVDERNRLVAPLMQESTDLNQNEKIRRNEDYLRSGIEAIDEEIANAESILEDVQQRIEEGDLSDPFLLDAAISDLNSLNEQKSKALRLLSEAEKARTAWAESVKNNASESEVESLRQDAVSATTALSEFLGMGASNVLDAYGKQEAAPDATTDAELQSEQEAAARGADSWVRESIENQEPTSLTREALEGILASDNYGILTAENPNNKALNEASNTERNNRLRAALTEAGLTFHEVKGRYDGKGENSFIVEGMTDEDAKAFAREFSQHSIVTPRGLIKPDGSIGKLDNVKYIDSVTDGENFFTAIKLADGSTLGFKRDLTNEFVDKDGNPIEEDSFWDGEAEEGPTVSNIVDKDQTQEFVPNKDGTFGFNEANTGLNRENVVLLNRLINSISSLLGKTFKVRLENNPDDDTYGQYSPSNNVLSLNMASLVKMQEGLEKGKSLKENFHQVLYEEVSHSMQSNAIESATFEQLQLFARGFFQAININKNVEDRIIRKLQSYLTDFADEYAAKLDVRPIQDAIDSLGEGLDINDFVNNILPNILDIERKKGESDESYELRKQNQRRAVDLIVDEMVADMVGFISQDSSIINSPDLLTKIKDLINQLLASVGMKDASFIETEADVRAYLIGLTKLKEGSRPFSGKLRFEGQGQKSTIGQKLSSRMSKGLSPARLPNDKPFTMSFLVPAIRSGEYSQGDGYYKQMTFNDKWHFVNWWRRTTREGRIPYGSFIAEVDGKRFEVEPKVISTWKMKPLDPVKSTAQEMARSRQEVADYVAGLDENDVDTEGTTYTSKYGFETKASYTRFNLASVINAEIASRIAGRKIGYKEESGMQLASDAVLSKANPYEISRVTDEVLSELKGETPTSSLIRKSRAIGERVTPEARKRAQEYKRSEIRRKLGVDANNLSKIHEEQSAQVYIERYDEYGAQVGSKENKRVTSEIATEVAEITNEISKEAGINVKNIFKDTSDATRRFLNRLSKEPGLEAAASYKPIFDIIYAITSNGIDVVPNTRIAKAVFRDLMLGKSPEDVNKSLSQMGERGKASMVYVRNLVDFMSSDEAKQFFNQDGSFNEESFVKWASTEIGRSASGTTLRNIHKIFSLAKKIKDTEAVKLPNYALSLMEAEGDYIIPDMNVIDGYNIFSGKLFEKRIEVDPITRTDREAIDEAWDEMFPNVKEEDRPKDQIQLLKEVYEGIEGKDKEDLSDSQKTCKRIVENKIRSVLSRYAGKSTIDDILVMISNVRDNLNKSLPKGEAKWTLQTVSQLLYLDGKATKNPDSFFSDFRTMAQLLDDKSTDSKSTREAVNEAKREQIAIEAKETLKRYDLPAFWGRRGAPMTAFGEIFAAPNEEGEIEAHESRSYEERPAPQTGTQTIIRQASLVIPKSVVEKARNFEVIDSSDLKFIEEQGKVAESPVPNNGIELTPDPFGSGSFIEPNGRAVLEASEIVMHDGKVYASGRVKFSPEAVGHTGPWVENPPQEVLDGLSEYLKAMFGREVTHPEALKEAYNRLPLESKKALEESPVIEKITRQSKRLKIGKRIRQTAERSASEYSPVRQEILNNPENYISRQKLAPIKEQLKYLSQEDLVAIMTDDGLGRLSNRNDDVGVLAGAELIRRKIEAGDTDAIPALIEELSKVGTTAGRILRHFRELKGSTPRGLAAIVEKAVQKKGNTLTEAQQKELNKIASDLFEAQKKQKDLMERAIKGEDVETELDAANKLVKGFERKLDTFANKYIEKGWGQIGQMLIQGNLLTPMSQFTNVGANLVNALVKVPVDLLALPLERLAGAFNLASPLKRNMSINAYMYGLRRFGSGFVEALDQIVTGQESEVTEWRMNRGFAPFRSIIAAYKGGDMLPLGPDGKASASQRAKLFVQGTLGVPAEVMFRFLSLGDTPFRRMIEGYELYQTGLSMGLEGEALMKFVKHPTRAQMERAAVEGRKLTFQEETTASKVAEDAVSFAERLFSKAFDWLPSVDGMAFGKFFVRSNIPYVRTPANILYDTLTFVTPYVAIPRMLSEASRGDTRSASQTLAKLMIGTTAAQTAAMLVREGLLSGSIEWDEEEEKNIAYDQFPPNSINVSGLQRWIKGEDTAKRNDDYFIGYNKLGVLGAIFGATAKATQRDEASEVDPFSANRILRDAFGINAFSSISHMMDQSFLQGMTNLIDVLSASDVDDLESTSERWLGSMFQAVSATVLPNTLTAMNRMQRQYMPDMRVTKDMTWEERLLKKFEYTIKDRTFNTDGIPVRVNWKGEPIEQTPRGTTPIAYQVFDITKARQGEDDFVSNEIWRLYESTEDLTDAVGTPYYAQKRKISVPSMSLKTKKEKEAFKKLGKDYQFLKDEEFVNGTVALTTAQINKLMEISGKQRYSELEALVSSQAYSKMTDKERIEAMNDIHDNYRSLKEYDGDSFKPHTIQTLDFIEEQYLKMNGRD